MIYTCAKGLGGVGCNFPEDEDLPAIGYLRRSSLE